MLGRCSCLSYKYITRTHSFAFPSLLSSIMIICVPWQPTRFPTKEPTDSPTESPTTVPSVSPSVSLLPTMAPIPYIRPARVDVRFAPWTDLTDEQKTSASGLGYDETTWDQYGTNDVELLDWAGLTDDQREDAEALGFDELSWDW